jgi:hypothetical protein
VTITHSVDRVYIVMYHALIALASVLCLYVRRGLAVFRQFSGKRGAFFLRQGGAFDFEACTPGYVMGPPTSSSPKIFPLTLAIDIRVLVSGRGFQEMINV